MFGGVEVLALFAELLDAELLEGFVDLGGNGLERVVHLAVFANAVDIVEGGQQRGQHVDDAVLAEALLLLLRAIAVVDELRTFALQGFEVVCGFLLGLAEGGEGVFGIGGSGIGRAIARLFRSGVRRGLSLSRGLRRASSLVRGSLGCGLGFGRVLRRGGSGTLSGLVGIRQVVQVVVLVELGHHLLSLSSSSSTTSASTVSSSEPEAEPAEAPAPAAPAAPAPAAAPSAPCWA